ncbi:MAG: PAS domain-containing protein [Ideonella sp.]|nr:PAS domain-containing protein [Ideonella sp.]
MNPDHAVPDAVTAPVLALDADAVVRGVNAAFAGACAARDPVLGKPFAALCDERAADTRASLPALHDALRRRAPLDDLHVTLCDGRGEPWPVSMSARPVGDSMWLTLLDRRDALRAERLQELLDMAQEFGRIGVFERDPRTLRGHWDRHMPRFWGLPPGHPALDFDQATAYIVPEDRAGLAAKFLDSVKQAGSYSHHYRVRGGDGVLRRLHSQWMVADGADGRPDRVLGVIMDDTEIWRLAQSVHETNAQLELALQLSGIGVWRHDLAADRHHFDDQVWRLLGLTPRPEGISRDELRTRVHPDDVPVVQAALERALQATGPTDMEARYRHADGRWLDVLTRRITQRDASGTPVAFIGVAMDITERQGEQRRLQDLTRRLELAASAAGVGIWSYDEATDTAVWNAQMYTLHGLDPSLPAPNRAEYRARFVAPEFRDVMEYRASRSHGDGQHIEQSDLQIIRTDGTRREVAMRVRNLQTESGLQRIGVMIDITESRAARRALREANERAALATRAVGLGTWELDLRTRQAIWDDQMWRLRGLEPREQAPPEPEREALVHPDDLAAMRREYEAAARERRHGTQQFRVRWPDGGWHWLASRSLPLFDAAGHEVRRIGVNWDITQAREAEQARQERALAQRESRAKSQFLARMSHELRTPLHAVIGFARLLLDKSSLRLDPEPREQLRHIHAAGEHLLALVNDVLDLSSLDTGEIKFDPQVVPLRELVDAATPMVAALAAQHGVRLDTGTLDLAVWADPTRLRQVLLNLLSNAIKYNRHGGTVMVEARALDGTRVALCVRDSGRGMTAAQLAHVFEPFNRLGLEGKGIEGTGIGLAIVKANVERMGGDVQVQSTPGVGSTFEVRLPRPQPDAPAQRPPSLPARAAPMPEPLAAGRHGRLLYIEDNPVNALIVRELVAQRGQLVLDEAADGASGIASAHRQRPDLILLDMQLPDLDGLEVLRRLRADPETSAIPCIALSANAMPDDIAQALGAGFADYWTKPLDFRVFMNTLDTLFGKR